MKHFEVKIAYVKQITNPEDKDCGKVKKVKETYVVDAETCAEAEYRLTKYLTDEQGVKGDWNIGSIKELKVREIIVPDVDDVDDPDALPSNIYKARVTLCIIDENTGTETWKAIDVLVYGDTFNAALRTLNTRMDASGSNYSVVSMVLYNATLVHVYTTKIGFNK